MGPEGRYVNKYLAYAAGVAPAVIHAMLVVLINEPSAGKYYGGAVSAPVFGSIMGEVLRLMNVEPDALQPNEQNEIVNSQKEVKSGRS